MNPKTKYGYVMTVFAPFLNPNFHLPLFYRLLLPWTAWIASGFKYLLGWAEKQEACEVFSPLLWVNSKFTVYKIICQRKLYSNRNFQYQIDSLKFFGRNTKLPKAFFGNSSTLWCNNQLVKSPVDLYLNFEKSSWKNQIRRTGFLAYKNQFWNWFLQAKQALKIQFVKLDFSKLIFLEILYRSTGGKFLYVHVKVFYLM